MNFKKEYMWDFLAAILAYVWAMMCFAWKPEGNILRPAVITAAVTMGLGLWVPIIMKKRIVITVAFALGLITTLFM